MTDLLDALFEERDLLDEVELDPEDKIIFSAEMAKRIREEVRKEISKMPVGKIIASLISKQSNSQIEREMGIKTNVSKEITKTKADLEKELEQLKAEFKENLEKMKKRFDDLRTELANQPAYQFGGFAPPNPLGKSNNSVLTNVNGTWAGLDWVPSSGGGLAPGTFTIANNTPNYSFDATGSSVDDLYQAFATLVRKLQGEI